MAEVLVKTHLIVTDVHEEYNINWCGKIINTKPKIKMVNLYLRLLVVEDVLN